jgi:hypothetical protein
MYPKHIGLRPKRIQNKAGHVVHCQPLTSGMQHAWHPAPSHDGEGAEQSAKCLHPHMDMTAPHHNTL